MRAARRGHAYWGVGGTADRTIGSADSISARVNRAQAIVFPVAVDQTDETCCGGDQTPASSLRSIAPKSGKPDFGARPPSTKVENKILPMSRIEEQTFVRGGRPRRWATQDEVRWVSSTNLTHLAFPHQKQ